MKVNGVRVSPAMRPPEQRWVYRDGERFRVRVRHPLDWRRLVHVGQYATEHEARRGRDEALERMRKGEL